MSLDSSGAGTGDLVNVLAPAITCIVAVHMKPTTGESLRSVVTQTRRDIQIIVIDSGLWIARDDAVSLAMEQAYRTYSDEPRVEWYITGELPGLHERACPISWATNQVIRAGLVRGRYVCTFYDDDLYEPTYMEKMGGYLDEHPNVKAVWCSQRRVRVERSGRHVETPPIRAKGVKTGAQFDQLVDGTQVMFHRSLLDTLGDPWLPESPLDSDCRHSDGVFLDRIGLAAGDVPNIDEFLVTHRFTPHSTYSPT